MQVMENVPQKINFSRQRVAELSNLEQRLSAAGDIDVKCPTMQSGNDTTVAPEILL